jgi:hypothetical protein
MRHLLFTAALELPCKHIPGMHIFHTYVILRLYYDYILAKYIIFTSKVMGVYMYKDNEIIGTYSSIEYNNKIEIKFGDDNIYSYIKEYFLSNYQLPIHWKIGDDDSTFKCVQLLYIALHIGCTDELCNCDIDNKLYRLKDRNELFWFELYGGENRIMIRPNIDQMLEDIKADMKMIERNYNETYTLCMCNGVYNIWLPPEIMYQMNSMKPVDKYNSITQHYFRKYNAIPIDEYSKDMIDRYDLHKPGLVLKNNSGNSGCIIN